MEREMGNELEGLAEPVREAIVLMDERNTVYGCWNLLRAELIRLARELRAERLSNAAANEVNCAALERAETELAALRKRIAESPVVSVSRHPISGVMKAVVSD